MYKDPETGELVNGIKRVAWSHDAMIDLMIAQPFATQGEIASYFGYTQGWVSTMIASDSFQARLAERKKELVDPLIIKSVEERFRAVAQLSLDKVLDRLASDKGSEDFLIKSAKLAGDALGYGAKGPSGGAGGHAQVVINMPGVQPTAVEWAAKYSQGQAPILEQREATKADLVIDHEKALPVRSR